MKHFLVILISLSPFLADAQVSSRKQEKSKEAVQSAQLAVQKMDYPSAETLYRKAIKYNPQNTEALYGLTRALQRNGAPEKEQKEWLLKLQEVGVSRQTAGALNHLSVLYAHENKYDSALLLLTNFIDVAQLDLSAKPQLKKRHSDYTFAARQMEKPLEVNPVKLGVTINDPNYLQYFPSVTGDNQQMLYTRRRKGGQNEDLYMSTWEGNGWSVGERLPRHINSSESEGTSCISADGRTIVFTYCGGQRINHSNCDLFESRYKNDEWTNPVNLGTGVNSKHWESQPSLSGDGNTLYFVSDRPKGKGGTDIYVSHRLADESWSNVQILPENVNTSANENSPFIHPNGESLFFASQGFVGFGGYDLYMAEFKENTWSGPQNLGYPINDNASQLSLFITADGSTAYFSKEEKAGSDITAVNASIFSFDIPKELHLGHRSNHVKGKVYDRLTNDPLEANIEVINLETNERLGYTTSDFKTGEYATLLNEGSLYGLFIEKKGYFFFSTSFEYDENDHFEPVKLDVPLNPIKKGVTVTLNNIYFDFNKSNLKPTSYPELNKLVKLLKENNTVKIEITGHTDNKGSAEYNKKLSQKRAAAVLAYLTKNGIQASRLNAIGAGQNQPIATNETEEGRALNRRVVFEIK